MIIILGILFIIIILLFYHFISNKKQTFISNKKQTIPKVIYQTYISKTKIPLKVYDNIKKYAYNYKHIVYDDRECSEFISKYFGSKITKKFAELKGAHKADLFRYCILYVKGGIYLDIKTQLIIDIDRIFKKKNTMYTVLAKKDGKIYQGIIASPKNNKLFLKLIEFVLNVNTKDLVSKKNYHIFISDMYNKINKLTQGTRLKEGLNKSQDNSLNYVLFKEKCSRVGSDCHDGLDRYGYCCNVYNNNKKIFKTRYSDFPW